MQAMLCLRCRREIEMGDKSVAVYMFAQTVGVRPRQKSTAQRICFCPQCAVSLAMGLPPDGALNMAAWEMIRDLVSAEPSLNEAAWENLRGIVGLLGPGSIGGRGEAAKGRCYDPIVVFTSKESKYPPLRPRSGQALSHITRQG